MKFQNIQAVLFDLDGTLIDSAPDLGAAVDKMRVDRGMTSLHWLITGTWRVQVPAA
jgi:N-acetyl-D-muramate 6-phosphate phosphatase